MTYDVSECLKNHHSEWFTRKCISSDQLGYHVKADLLVRYGLDHSCGHNIERRDAQRNYQTPDWHLRGPNFDRYCTDREYDDCGTEIRSYQARRRKQVRTHQEC